MSIVSAARPTAVQRATMARQYPLGLAVVLHLFPGATLAACMVVATPTFESWGVDRFLVFLLGIGVVIAPLELGYLALHARRTTGCWSPAAALDYRTAGVEVYFRGHLLPRIDRYGRGAPVTNTVLFTNNVFVLMLLAAYVSGA